MQFSGAWRRCDALHPNGNVDACCLLQTYIAPKHKTHFDWAFCFTTRVSRDARDAS